MGSACRAQMLHPGFDVKADCAWHWVVDCALVLWIYRETHIATCEKGVESFCAILLHMHTEMLFVRACVPEKTESSRIAVFRKSQSLDECVQSLESTPQDLNARSLSLYIHYYITSLDNMMYMSLETNVFF